MLDFPARFPVKCVVSLMSPTFMICLRTEDGVFCLKCLLTPACSPPHKWSPHCPDGSFPVNSGPSLPDILQDSIILLLLRDNNLPATVFCARAPWIPEQEQQPVGVRRTQQSDLRSSLGASLCMCHVPLLEFLLECSRFTMLC